MARVRATAQDPWKSPRVFELPFVGRKQELTLLTAQVARARDGVPTVVVVEGPAGMGKTALVRRVLDGAADFRVLVAAAEDWESRVAGGVVAQLLARAGEAREQQSPTDRVAPDPFASGAELLGLLSRLQEGGPVAVVVDDVQWADSLSVQALAFALRRMQRDQVLAVFVARDEAPGLPEALRRLSLGKGDVNLRLGGLDASELIELSVAVRGRELSRRSAQQLCDHTVGNPLHARALLEELGQDALEGDVAVLPAPRSFAMVVMARLAGCTLETVQLVQAAAVLGQRCGVGAAAAVADVADPAAALDEAVAVRLLDPWPQRQVAFFHPLVRAAIYHDLGPSRRCALHGRAAAVLEGGASLFHRVEAALVEDPVLARDVEVHARQQLASGALASGADALLAAARLSPDRCLRESLVLDALDALLTAGEVAHAAVVAKEATGFVDSARRRCLLGRLALTRGRQEEAEAWLGSAWELLDPGADQDLRALVAAEMAQVCAMQLRSAEAAEWARRAIDASADPELTTCALSILVPCLGRVGRPAEALAAAARLPHDGGPGPVVHVEALLGRGMVRLWVDDLEQARADLSAVVAACRDRPASRQALVALGMLADAEFRLGAWDDSVVHATQVVSLVEDSEQVWFGAFAHAAATQVLAPRGDFERAAAHARAAAEAGRMLGDATSVGCAATAAANVAFFRGDLAEATLAVQPMLELGARADDDDPSVHPWREVHIEALLRLGRLEEAEAALEALECLALARDRRSSLAHAARLRAALEAIRGHHHAARAGFELAVDRAHELGNPFALARAESDYGSYLRRLGECRAAGTHLRAASDGFSALGARPLAERCQQELAACGLTPSSGAARPSSELTPQELAVTRLVTAGRTNREVAAALIVSTKTVEYHLSHIYAKLGVRSRTQLAVLLGAACS